MGWSRVTARAFAPLPRLLELASPFFRAAENQGKTPLGLFLKGKKVDEELRAAQEKWSFTAQKIASRSHPGAIVLAIHPQGLVGKDP